MTTLADKLGALHVWPQHVADNYADTLTRKEIEKLYEVGNVAEEALRALRERDQAVEALRLYAGWGCINPDYDDFVRTDCGEKARAALASIEGTGHE